ncbi:MAG TPA: nucleotidyltransferase domain-containing protein [Candidatus Bathyarchaeia archaeon]|nr:nucleotidyltransferase domain-containing protein [Candidatus Bathyarchaeia archaeon]
MGIDQTTIDEIVRRVTSVVPAKKIIVFGSAATGQITPDSDVDLLVVQADPGDRRKESVRIHSALRGLGYPFDVIVIGAEWFEASKNVIGGIAYPANKYGRVIYDAA